MQRQGRDGLERAGAGSSARLGGRGRAGADARACSACSALAGTWQMVGMVMEGYGWSRRLPCRTGPTGIALNSPRRYRNISGRKRDGHACRRAASHRDGHKKDEQILHRLIQRRRIHEGSERLAAARAGLLPG
jgi:hypothetical protein